MERGRLVAAVSRLAKDHDDREELLEYLARQDIGPHFLNFLKEVEDGFRPVTLTAHVSFDPEEPEYRCIVLDIESDLPFEAAFSKIGELRKLPVYTFLRGHLALLLA